MRRRILNPLVTLFISVFIAVSAEAAPHAAAQESNPIPPGTTITLKNWRQFSQYMPEGMQALFTGAYSWKLPSDFQLVVGPASFYPLPESYVANTRKYSSQVKIKDLPDGGHTIEGYVAGQPFPNPADPLKGYKILVNVWYRYIPYLFCGAENYDYLKNGVGAVNSVRLAEVFRRLSHISDRGQAITDPHAQGVDYSEYLVVLEPEQDKYTEALTLYYTDPARPEDDFIFSPRLRRVIRESPSSRCAPANGTDFIFDDYRAGFNGGIARFQNEYLRDQAILTLVNSEPVHYGNPANYYPLFFPMPVIGKWEVHDTYVTDLRRIPSQQAGYCYGKEISYIDKYTYNMLWKDLYDSSMKFFKINLLEHIAGPVPGEGMQFETGNSIQVMWDINRNHLTAYITAGPDGKAIVNNEACRNVDGVNYDDIQTYSTVGGLTQIMR